METDAFQHWDETPGSTLWIRGKRKSSTSFRGLGSELKNGC
jgi:hypothetical protein